MKAREKNNEAILIKKEKRGGDCGLCAGFVHESGNHNNFSFTDLRLDDFVIPFKRYCSEYKDCQNDCNNKSNKI